MKKALITGASSGIGEALAYALEKKDYSLLVTGRNQEKLALFSKHKSLIWDLSKGVAPLLDWIEEEEPDLVVNNAGFGIYDRFEKFTEDEVQEMIHVNITAVSLLTKKAIEVWKKANKKGVVLNVASAAAFFPMPFGSLYAASKAFVTHFSRSLDAEVRACGIRVLSFNPGVIETQFQKRAQRHGEGQRSFGVISLESTIEAMLQQIEQGKKVKVHNSWYRFLRALLPLTPTTWVENIVANTLYKK